METVHPLKAYREKQDPPLSHEKLAALLGVTRETVSRWESGTRKIKPAILPVIAERTGISPSELRPDLASFLGEPAQ